MKKIIALNGSPKKRNSASTSLIEQVTKLLNQDITSYQVIDFINQNDFSSLVTEIVNADVLLIVSPLYIDSLPAPLIKLLKTIEDNLKSEKLPVVYSIINCGFLEASQNQLALKMVECFSHVCGFGWGYGIGIGCGGLLLTEDFSEPPLTLVYQQLQLFCEDIRNNIKEKENVFVSPDITRFSYIHGGNLNWYYVTKKYNKQRFIKAKPHKEENLP